MINHFRTLLANLPAGGSDLGEEKIPDSFRPVTLPDTVVAVRRVLFGDTPDRAMVNYRCRQLLACVHSSVLAEWVTKLDPRVAYDFLDRELVGPAPYTPRVLQTSGPAAKLTVLGAPAAPDSTGVMRLAYTVDVLSEATVSVYRHTDPAGKTIYDYAVTGGASQPLVLPGAGYSVRLYTDDPGSEWTIDVYNRPQRDVGELAVALESIGDAHVVNLFGVEAAEPYTTLRRVWRASRETPLRVAAAVIASVYRTEESRRV